MINSFFQKIKKELPETRRNVLLKNYTTFKIGGPAKYFCEVKTKKDLSAATKTAKKFDLPFFILGRGSKLLVSDRGFEGLVIRIQNSKFKIQSCNSEFKITCGAGVSLGNLVSQSFKIGATGWEWAAGIPGTIGGAIYGNTGAFNGAIADIVKEVEIFDLKNNKFKILRKKDCKFGYKDSVFKKNKNLVIWSAMINLKKGNRKEIGQKIKNFLKTKNQNQPLDYPSAGCVFKNPKISNFKKIKQEMRNKIFEDIKSGRLTVKNNIIPAGYLIEMAGLKGEITGGAKISQKHSNFIINFKNAKAEDVTRLIKIIKEKIKNSFGILLKEEIQLLNDSEKRCNGQ